MGQILHSIIMLAAYLTELMDCFELFSCSEFSNCHTLIVKP